MPGYSGASRYLSTHSELPEAPLVSVVLTSVAALLLLAYAAWLARANGWNGMVRNYVIAAAILIGIVVLYAYDRL